MRQSGRRASAVHGGPAPRTRCTISRWRRASETGGAAHRHTGCTVGRGEGLGPTQHTGTGREAPDASLCRWTRTRLRAVAARERRPHGVQPLPADVAPSGGPARVELASSTSPHPGLAAPCVLPAACGPRPPAGHRRPLHSRQQVASIGCSLSGAKECPHAPRSRARRAPDSSSTRPSTRQGSEDPG